MIRRYCWNTFITVNQNIDGERAFQDNPLHFIEVYSSG